MIVNYLVSHPFRRRFQKAGSSTPLRFAQKDGARGITETMKMLSQKRLPIQAAFSENTTG
jgi:hypothetical protein